MYRTLLGFDYTDLILDIVAFPDLSHWRWKDEHELRFAVEATDIDDDDLNIEVFSDNLPEGCDFTDRGNGSGLFTWTPGFTDNGNYSLLVTVSDAEFDVESEISIIIENVNRSPVWDDIPYSVNVEEGNEVAFNISGSDPDGDQIGIEAVSDDLPDGWSLVP